MTCHRAGLPCRSELRAATMPTSRADCDKSQTAPTEAPWTNSNPPWSAAATMRAKSALCLSRPRISGDTRNQVMVCPPLAESVDPVMKPASSAARNTTQRAISSGWPRRRTGICGKIDFSSTSLGTAITISVAI